jgi:hypothetical protein
VLKQYPTLRVEVGNAATSLDKMRDESKKATLQLVDMECGYLTVEYFRKLPEDIFVCRFCALVVSRLILVFHSVIIVVGRAQNRVREREREIYFGGLVFVLCFGGLKQSMVSSTASLAHFSILTEKSMQTRSQMIRLTSYVNYH